MPIRQGDKEVMAMYLGSNEILKMYKGSTQVGPDVYYITFYCHKYGQDQGTLYLEGGDGTSGNEIGSYSGEHSSSWFSVNSGDFSGYAKIRFRNVAAGGYMGDVSLDYIQIYKFGNLEYTESFESDMGEWLHAPGNETNWARISGGTPSNNTGPSSAYNGTYYIYVETTRDGNVGSNYSGNTDIIEYTFPCKHYITFYYHQFGTDQGTLYLEGGDGTSGNEIGSASSNGYIDAGLKGHSGELTGYTKIRFRNVAAGDFLGDIALDYIQEYKDDTLQYTESFESDMGNGTNDTNNTSDGIRNSGGTPSSGTGPIAAYNGTYYIYVETSSGSSFNTGDTDIIEYTLST